MAKVAKRTRAARDLFAGKANVTVEEAVDLIKQAASAKFDETLEIAMNLGVDPRHADQMVRGVVSLPNGTGKTVRVAVFARGEKADEAKEAGALVVGSGRSDFPNQVNNVLAFPGIFRGALDCRARDISAGMKLAAAKAIAAVAAEDGLTETYILPDAFDKRVTAYVAAAVAAAATEEGMARVPLTYEEEKQRVEQLLRKDK